MLSFSDYLDENYKNFIGPDSVEKRRVWADPVWDILQKSYESIGGIKGKGFSSKEDMIRNIPFWKIYTKSGKVVAAAFYKDKGGRKAVAIATDGTAQGLKIVDDIFKSALGTSYGEKSGKSLGKLVKGVDWDTLSKFLITPANIAKITGDSITPIEKYGSDNLDPKDLFTYNKYPELRPFMYVREIGGHMHLKVAVGTPGLKIV